MSPVAPAAAPTGEPAPEPVRPFLKWAGGKRQLLPFILRQLPQDFRRYYEPFAGGAALFFHLGRKKALLADTNERLIRTYRGLRDEPERVIEKLRKYPHTKEFFLKLRDRKIDRQDDASVAAWFIYLNKTGYNGLYRVNSKNRFNVPFGRYSNPKICDEARLLACAGRLHGVTLKHADFAAAVRGARAGDLVYFDPPYAPLSATSSFTSYTAGGFDEEQQRRLRDKALALAARGVHVIISNSSAALIKQLYKGDFRQLKVPARRSINSKISGRGSVTELLIVSPSITAAARRKAR